MTKFKPTLAATIESHTQLKFPLLASPKLDGIRALGTQRNLISRTLKPLPNKSLQAAWKAALAANSSLAHLFESFDGEVTITHDPTTVPTASTLVEHLPSQPKATKQAIINNSTIGHMPFSGHPNSLEKPAEYNDNQSAIMSADPDPEAIYSRYNTKAKPGSKSVVTGTLVYPDNPGLQLTYWVFDSYRTPTENYLDRYQDLKNALRALHIKHNYGCLHIVRLPYIYIPNLVALLAYEELCLANGFEGVIVRTPGAPYKFGRSTVRQLYLAKLKRFVDDEARIVDFEEQLENTNAPTKTDVSIGSLVGNIGTERSHELAGMVPKNTLGALICEHPTFGLIRVGTGKGLTNSLRKKIWENQDAYNGQIIKFKYFPIGVQDKPRIPSFQGFRSPIDM